MESGKIDPSLVNIPHPSTIDNSLTDINAGLDENSNIWEVIVKYNGDILVIQEALNAYVEILNNSYAIVTLPLENINKLASYSEVEFVEKPKVLGIMQAASDSLFKSCITPVQRDLSLNLTGKGVIVAILDSGIDYAHPDFLDSNGNTRILYLWDQSIQGNPPNGFRDGSEYTQDDINEALRLGTSMGERMSRVPSMDHMGHGTGVAGIACGKDGAAPEASMIIVKIGRNIDRGFARTTELMRGLKYVISKATELNMPISVNVSFGTNDGSHDGRSLFETFINDISQQWKTNIVVASGNEGDTGKHYKGVISQNSTVNVEFSVGGNLKTLPITLWKSFVDKFAFEIISPDGVSTGIINYSSDLRRFIFSTCVLYISFGQPTQYNEDQEVYFQFVANPNMDINSGIWTISVKPVSIVQGDFDMWLPITEMVSNQTYFLSSDTNITLTLPSTALNVITVGGYDSTINTVSSFSGKGYTRTFNIVKPDLVAPAVGIVTSAPGGSYNAKTGTSFAAPHVAGSVALLMQWGIVDGNDLFLYGQKTKAYLQLGARRESSLTYPNPQWGYGALCLMNSINYLREFAIIPGGNFGLIGVSKELETMEKPNNVNKVLSEDYIDLVIKNNANSAEYLEENEEWTFNQTLLSEYGILNIHKDKLSEFKEGMGQLVVQENPKLLGLMGRQSIEASGILAVQNYPYLSLKGTGTLIGIIDTGINYTNNAFVYEDNTSKIDFLWDQTIQNDKPPADFTYGTEYTNADINRALKSDNPFEIVPHRDDVGHGTFLASVACGRESQNINYIGAAPDANLIVVKLKPAKKYLREEEAISDTIENVYQSSDFMAGLEYIRLRAISLGKPVAICISVGTNLGAHDGLSIFEEYISRVAIRNGVVIAAAMGNEGRSRSHMMGTIEETGNDKDVELRIGENESGITIGIYAYPSDKLSIRITSPTGEFINPIFARGSSVYETDLLLEESKIRVSYLASSEKNASEEIYVRIVKPTPGIWKITVHGDLITDGRFHTWLPITEFIGNDTYFLESDPNFSMTIPSTSYSVVSVGAYNSLDGTLYVATGRGPTRGFSMEPAFVAPGVNVDGVIGVNFGTMTGTSVAAAITAGASSLLLQWGILQQNEIIFNSIRANSYLIKGCTRKDSLDYPNYQWGYGELNLIRSFEVLRIT